MVVTKKGIKKNLIKEIQSEYLGDIPENKKEEDKKNFFKYSSLSSVRPSITTESFEKELGFPIKDRAETKLYKSGFIKTAAGETSYVDTQFYTPRLSGETWYLPRSRKMLLRWVKVYYDYDPYIKSILTMHSRYPISPFKLVDENREKVELFESVLHQDDWDISDTMLKGSLSMQKYGESCLLSSWNKQYGIWDNICPLDPTLIEVEEIPMTTKVNIYTEIPDKYKKIYKENLNNEEALRTLPEEITQVLKLGGDYIQLNTQEEGYLANYKPASALMLANSTDVGEGGVRGTPPILSLLRCMHGDTKVALLDGTTPTLKELYEKGIEDFEVYNLDDNHNITPGKSQKVIKTQKEKGIVITFDNGESIIVTKDHPLMTRNGEYVEAQKLKVGDSMMPLYKKDINFKNKASYRKIYNPADSKWYWEHQLLLNRQHTQKDGMVIHHGNRNGQDNRLSNMFLMTNEEHAKYHQEHNHILTPELIKKGQAMATEAKHKQSFKDKQKKIQNSPRIKEQKKKYMEEVWRNRTQEQKEYIFECGRQGTRAYYETEEGKKKKLLSAEQLLKDANLFRAKVNAERLIEQIQIGKDNKRCTRCGEVYVKTDFRKKVSYYEGLDNVCIHCRAKEWQNNKGTEKHSKSIKDGQFKHYKKYCEKHNIDIEEAYISMNNWLNHKIIKIEDTTEKHQFYAVQNASPYFNFAIAFNDGSGIFSKNTLVYKDFLKKAQFERAKRYAYPLEIWSLGRVSEDASNSIIPDDEDLEYVRGMLKTALANPPFTIIYNPLLNYQVFGATGALLNITEDLNFCENDMLVGLGVNKTIVLGEGSWLGTSKTIPLQRLLMDYQTDRDMWETKFLKNYVFRALCMRWGYTQEQKITGRRKILTPRVVWNRDLDPDASSEKRKDYMSLWKDKLISSETLVARYPDIDIYEEARKLEKESMTYIGQLRGLAVPKPKGEEVPEGTKPSAPESPKKPEKPKEEEKEKTDNTETKIDTEAPLTPPPPRPKEKIKVVPDKE